MHCCSDSTVMVRLILLLSQEQDEMSFAMKIVNGVGQLCDVMTTVNKNPLERFGNNDSIGRLGRLFAIVRQQPLILTRTSNTN